jgi:hypothetical protein
MEGQTLVALISACIALVSMLVTFAVSREARRSSATTQNDIQRFQRDLKRLEDDLIVRRDEGKARRDYEYEALKRLYHECSPLRFQLAEHCGQLLSRIHGLALSAAEGSLDGPNSWLSSRAERYYRRSTEYRLLAPLAAYTLLHRRLTHLDLSLDPDLHVLYQLSKALARVMADDFEIAALGDQPLPYDPHAEVTKEIRDATPATYLQQGVPRGILENAVESMIATDAGVPRVMSFLEFEAAMDNSQSRVHAAVDRIRYLFRDFHPATRPVMWRVLLAMASLCRAIQNWTQHKPAEVPTFRELTAIPADAARKYQWQRNGATGSESPDSALKAAAQYVTRYVEPQVQPLLAARVPA